MLGYDGQLFGELSIEKYSEETRDHLGLVYDGGKAIGQWQASDLQPGQTLRQPSPLFTKLDPEIVEQERQYLGKERVEGRSPNRTAVVGASRWLARICDSLLQIRTTHRAALTHAGKGWYLPATVEQDRQGLGQPRAETEISHTCGLKPSSVCSFTSYGFLSYLSLSLRGCAVGRTECSARSFIEWVQMLMQEFD